MKPACFAIAVFLLSSGLAVSAQAAPKFEGASIPGSPKITGALFRIEIATGTVVNVWGAGPSFAAIAESAPLPPGEYHLYVTSELQADGSVSWNLSRMDVDSGRVWVLTGGGSVPFSWVAIQEPK